MYDDVGTDKSSEQIVGYFKICHHLFFLLFVVFFNESAARRSSFIWIFFEGLDEPHVYTFINTTTVSTYLEIWSRYTTNVNLYHLRIVYFICVSIRLAHSNILP